MSNRPHERVLAALESGDWVSSERLGVAENLGRVIQQLQKAGYNIATRPSREGATWDYRLVRHEGSLL